MPNIDFVRQVGVFRWAIRYALFQFQKRGLRRDINLRLPTGSMIVLPLSHPVSEIYVTNANIDWGADALFAKFADHRRDFLDIGANIGYYSNYLSPLVRNVYAFEPEPRNLAALHLNANLCGNVKVIAKAVSSHNGVARLAIGRDPATNTLQTRLGAKTIEVPVTTVDSFVADHPDIDVGLIKTDIEGHDFQALKGMGRTVKRFQPLILSECGNDPELPSLLRDWDYRIFGFVCDRKTFTLSFQEFTAESFRSKWYKMIFLTPPHINFTGCARVFK